MTSGWGLFISTLYPVPFKSNWGSPFIWKYRMLISLLDLLLVLPIYICMIPVASWWHYLRFRFYIKWMSFWPIVTPILKLMLVISVYFWFCFYVWVLCTACIWLSYSNKAMLNHITIASIEQGSTLFKQVNSKPWSWTLITLILELTGW